MRKLVFGLALTLPIAVATHASAMPGVSHNPLMQDARVIGDLIEVKGGHGWGGGRRPWLGPRPCVRATRLELRPKGGLARPRMSARPLEAGPLLSFALHLTEKAPADRPG